MKPTNFIPIYTSLYPQMVRVGEHHGYLLDAQGSMGRDFDILAVPSVETPDPPQLLINNILSHFAVTSVGKPEFKWQKQLMYTLNVKSGECLINLSFATRGPKYVQNVA